MGTQAADVFLGRLFGSPAMREVFCDQGLLQGLLDFEAALARAEARLGVIPEAAVAAIEAACRAERFDVEALGEAGVLAGNTAIPVVRTLIARVAESDEEASRHVHRGATSQDAMDTGLVLQMRAGLALIQRALGDLGDAAAELADRHRNTLMPGRTWMQHALPIPFGLKAAGWVDAVARHGRRLEELTPRVLVLQFGGAAGTLAGLGDRGQEVARELAAELELGLPEVPWHTHRDRIAETGAALAMVAGTLGKMARDISLLMQTEVGEAFEPALPGRGGSSSMPQKRNPVACSIMLAAAVRAPQLAATLLSGMVQEHERALGGWQAEWPVLPELFHLAAGALDQAVPMLRALEIDAGQMADNVEATGGQIMAEAVKVGLAERMGTPAAHALVERACRIAAEQGVHLREVLSGDAEVRAVLDARAMERLFDAGGYLGASHQFIDRALAAWRAHRKQ